MYDLAIIGGGPAGITAAIYARRAGKSVAIFEGGKLGGTLNYIEKIDNYPCFKRITGKALSQRMIRQMLALKPDVIKQFVTSVFKNVQAYSIITGSGEIKAKKVIYCGGRKRRGLKAAEGFGGTGISYCAVCDGFFYKNKDVVVVGSGYAAEEDVKYLQSLCKSVTLIGRIENLDPQITQYDEQIAQIHGENHVNAITLKSGKRLSTDGIFIALQGTNDVLLESIKNDEEIAVAGDALNEFNQIVWACASAAQAVTKLFKD